MINIKNVNPNLLNIDKIPYRNTDAFVYNIKYMKIVIMKILSVLVLVIQMHTLLEKVMKINT